MNKTLFFTLITLSLVGCGGENTSKSSPNTLNLPDIIPAQEKGKIEIAPSLAYSVLPGDKLIKTSDDAIVKITHVDLKKKSYIELIQGSASIIYNH